ncbi:MAG: helix-turn-helix transcriptional regulator [Clostridiales bacterium]|nr:helix-turn-helix transcriptional regulator [Clostridiales bacterium]
MKDIKQNIADNLIKLRTSAGITQAQLAESLSYTDKAVSKWERAESIPDITVLKRIADRFEVTVDWLITDHGSNTPAPDKEAQRTRSRNHLLITLLAVVCVWFVATLVFVALGALDIPRKYLSYLWAIPISAIVLLVFNAIWGRYRWNFLFISLLIWSFLVVVYITAAKWDFWYVFLVGIPLQLATVFWSQIKSVGKRLTSKIK